MTSKEVFLFDENAAIKKIESEVDLSKKFDQLEKLIDKKKTSSDLGDFKDKSRNLNYDNVEKNTTIDLNIDSKSQINISKDKSNYDCRTGNIIDDIDDPFFFV